jgi:hypothetical protein
MSIRTLQCLFSHSFTTYLWLNRDCDVQIYIGIRADELGNGVLVNEWKNDDIADIAISVDEHFFSNFFFNNM